MVKRFRRMSDSDMNTIVADLDRWALGELGAKLTWTVLEERFGFSRQSPKPSLKLKPLMTMPNKLCLVVS